MILMKRGNGVYYVEYDDNGRLRRVTTKARKKSDALTFLMNFKQNVEERKAQKTVPLDLQKFSMEYLEYSKAMHSPHMTRALVTTFNEMRLHFGNLRIASLTGEQIEGFITHRIRNSSVYAARKDYANLASSFNWAIRHSYLSVNPCKGVTKPRIPEKLPLFFSHDEFQALLSVMECDTDFRDITVFAVNTGCRQREIVELRWNQVDMQNKMVLLNNQVHRTKWNLVRTVPLNDSAIRVLQRRREVPVGEFVFTIDRKKIKQDYLQKWFKKYVREAGLNRGLHFHSLRHSFASWLVQRGVSIYQVSRLLGHRSVAMTEIYSHLYPEDLRETVDRLA